MSEANSRGAEESLVEKIGGLRHDLAALMVLWHERHEPALGWTNTPRVYSLLARAFIEVGASLLGLEVAAEGLESWPEDVGLRQVQGLSLARGGSTEAANRVLERLRGEGHLADETLGVLARTHKDLGLSGDGEPRRRHLAAAHALYSEAYAQSGSYWTGINVATLGALLGDRARAESVAREVTCACLAALNRLPESHGDRYWAVATLGEAALTLGELSRAEDWYRQAAELGRHRFGDLNSTRRHARLLLEHLGEDPERVEAWLPLPRVVVFSGHMIDRPDRPQPRFPPSLEPAVYAAIRDWLRDENGLIGFSSAACGADLLFLEALQELGGESHIVLPYHLEEFVQESVERPESGDWRKRFDRQVAQSRVVYASSSRPLHGGVAYDYANQLVHGLAALRACELQTSLLALAVWDGEVGDGLGGTASAVAQWLDHGIPVRRVCIETASATGGDLLELRPVDHAGSAAAREPFVGPEADRVMSLLFADAVGFSKLTDVEVPLFVEHCLGLVARMVAADPQSAPVRETWGDGLFLAFTTVRAAGVFALDLLDAINATDWRALGFERPLNMRLALHAGPVHLTTDPITGLPKCCGTHVSRAARLEPKTPPGQVYASEAFAALAAMDGIDAFRCDYVKQLDWAKRYGTFPAYVVSRGGGR